MAQSKNLAYLVGTVLQGGADAFAQNTIQTALDGQTKQAYRVVELEYEFNLPVVPVFPIGTVAVQDLEICLTRRTKTTMPDLTDVDIIKKWHFSASVLSAIGVVPMTNSSGIWTPPGEVILVEDPLYFQIDSTATSGTWQALIRISYEIVTISEIERLNLIARSLV